MSEPQAREAKSSEAGKGGALLTLTQVSERTGISMPTLQKYKKKFSDRIPSRGKGRTQRYPEEAVPVFRQLLEESGSRRGRPRKAEGGATKTTRTRASRKTRSARKPAAAKRRASASKAEAEGQKLLSLTEISKQTKISYPTLMRYVRAHLDQIPHVGEGRKRRFPPEAVAAFKKLYSGPRGGRKAAAPKAKRAAKAPRAARAPKAPRAARAPKAAAAKKKAGRPAKAAAKRPAAARRRAGGAASSGADVVRVLERLEARLSALEKELKKPIKIEVKR